MEQGVFAHSTVMPEGQDVEHGRTDNAAVDAAATKLLTRPVSLLSVAQAIAAHREAQEALNAACPAIDTVAIEQAGGDTSLDAMAPGRRAWEAANEAERAARDRLLAVRPTDPAELTEVIRYLADSRVIDDNSDDREGLRNLAEMAEALTTSHPSSRATADVIALAEEAVNAFVACRQMDEGLNAGRVTEGEQQAAFAQATAALEKLSNLQVKTWPDMALQCLVLGAEEAWDLNTHSDPARDYRTTRVGRQFEAMVHAMHPTLTPIRLPSGELRAVDFSATVARAAAWRPSDERGADVRHSPADLADACDWAVKHVDWMNETCSAEKWGDDKLNYEAKKSDAVWTRAYSEPAADLRTAAAKARMFLAEWNEECANEEGDKTIDDRDRVVAQLARDIVALYESQSGTGPKSEEPLRLDFTQEAFDLSTSISNLNRFASIADEVCDAAFGAQLPAGTRITVGDHETSSYIHLALTRDQARNLRFIVSHIKDIASDADKYYETFEDVLTKHRIIRDGEVAA